MTDYNDHANIDRPHTGPNGDDTTDAADASWFRAAVAPVVDAKPVADAWDEIHARATGEAPTVVHLDRSSGAGRIGTRRRLALAAAAVIAVAGIGGVAALTRDDGEGDETVTATPPPADGTGWYVPDDLPDGWELESVETDWMDVEGVYEACPCEQTVWISADGILSLAAVSADADKFSVLASAGGQGDVEPVVLDGGIEGHVATVADYQLVSWVQDGRGWQAASGTLERDAMIDAAGRVAADPTAPPVDGFNELFSSTASLESMRAFHAVSVRVRNADRGVALTYTLRPFDLDRPSIYLAGAVEELEPVSDEQPLYAARVEPRPDRPTGYNEIFVGGQWAGAWIMAGVGDSALSEGPVTEADVDALLRSLRAATGDEWRAFLDTATGSVEDDARADRLSDLIVHEGDLVPGLDQEPDGTTETSSGTSGSNLSNDEIAPAAALVAAAQGSLAGEDLFPTNLFAASVALGLDFETERTVGRPNLVDPAAWVIGGDDIEYYAGYTPPFSALELLGDADATSIAAGGPEGCATTDGPTPPSTASGQRLLTITPDDIDSCIDWFAVTLVIDDQDRIAAVHLYLREP